MSDIKELDTLDIYWDIFTENAKAKGAWSLGIIRLK